MSATAVTTEASEATDEKTVRVTVPGVGDVPLSQIQGDLEPARVIACPMHDQLTAAGHAAFTGGKGSTLRAMLKAGLIAFDREKDAESVQGSLRLPNGGERIFALPGSQDNQAEGKVKIPLVASDKASQRTARMAQENRAVFVSAHRAMFKPPRFVGAKDADGDALGEQAKLPGSIATVGLNGNGARFRAFSYGYEISTPSNDWEADDAPTRQDGMVAYWTRRATAPWSTKVTSDQEIAGRYADLMGL